MPPKSKKSSVVNTGRPTQQIDSSNTASNIQSPRVTDTKSSAVSTINGHSSASQLEADMRTGDTTESAGEPTPTPTVNRKKQKRREKEAAKRLAEEQLVNGHSATLTHTMDQISASRPSRGPTKGYFTEEPDYVDDEFQDDMAEPEDAFYSGDEDGSYPHEYVEDSNNSWLNTSKRKKSSKSRHNHLPHMPPPRTSSGVVRSHLPALSNAAIRSAHRMSNDHIWNTSTQAERENIKQFWLELGEEERRSLVKVEKEAVLRKMKEQQKHSCSCSVCGRKRTAIEEELEVLYDAYYEELEQFANHNNSVGNSPQVMPPPRTYRPLRGQVHPMAGSYPVTGRIRELGDNDEELDDEEDDLDDDEEEDEEDEDEEPYSDEEYDDELPPGPPDFFQFGNSLTVKVADDLLKNDGKHFIDMMEQLAERRMQREEEIHYPAPPLAHQSMRQGHNHPPIDDEDDYEDDEDDDDYESQEEDDFEGDEMDSMTEEQRMEEGRRMFQIFAARMFEQRVLTAYREKVAAERQRKLLEELDEESRLDTQREAKKAREAAKKKEKKARQKAVKDEEKARKDAEKAAQEAEAKAAEERKLEEQKKRKEEQRKKREAERKAAEEERIKREADRIKRAQEERERQAENEKKQREAREKDKRKKEEARKRDKEEREVKEKELREKRLKDEKERKAREEQIKVQKPEIQKADKDTKPKSEPTTRPQPVALPPGLQHSSIRLPPGQSPHLPVATPVIPASIATPGRGRQPSQPSQSLQPSQQSLSSSPKSQKAGTENSQPSASPASTTVSHQTGVGLPSKIHGQPPILHHPQPSAPRSPLNNVGRGGHFPYPMNGMPGLGVGGPPPGPAMMHGMMPPMPMYQGGPMANPQRFGPNGVNYPPPGFGGPRAFQQPQPMTYQPPHSNAGPIGPPTAPAVKPPSHTRQHSSAEQPAPIARPGPIGRPPSTTPEKQKPDHALDQITKQLGSSALLDDSDAPIISTIEPRTIVSTLGAPGSGRMPFANSFGEPNRGAFGVPVPTNTWNGLGASAPTTSWGPSGPRPSGSWPQQPFGSISGGPIHTPRSYGPRPINVRKWLVQACQSLSTISGAKSDGYFPVEAILQQVNNFNNPGDPPVSREEMLQMCDTEGNVQNGGGSFEVAKEKNGEHFVKFVEDSMSGSSRLSVGDIGSPLSSHSPNQPAPFGSIGQGFGPPGRHF